MTVVEIKVELTGSKNCLINGVDSFEPRAQHTFEEKVFLRQFSPDQQWHVLCDVRKLLCKLESVYNEGRKNRGELPL